MKQLTLNSEFFKNECAKSFLKAILGNNIRIDLEDPYITIERIFLGFTRPIFVASSYDADLYKMRSITFNLDDSFKVDNECIPIKYYIMLLVNPKNCNKYELNLDYLFTLEGVEIKEV